MEFKDHFSPQADRYALYRPSYPPALYAYLAQAAPRRRRAWDCATGSGQAARALAEHFDEVIATDASERQLAHAEAHPRVTYRRALAESSGLPAAAIDLVTVAQALHWFDFDRFYVELEWVVAPGGMFAAWCYGAFEAEGALGQALHRYHYDVVGPYWPPERQLIEDGYRTIPFPPPGWREIEPPGFEMAVYWTLPDLLGYLGTWSATRRFREARGRDPLEIVRGELEAAWGGEEKRRLAWPLALRAARR